uniref:Agglutinin domain-containing protein n=1 Tax=Zea mays TaxID=4577 RepID=A0A804MID5_MAIZE
MAHLISSAIAGAGNLVADGISGVTGVASQVVEGVEDTLGSIVEAIDQGVKDEDQLDLPKYVCFKGDNGLYLSARTVEGHPYLQFASEDIGDPSVRFITYNHKVNGKRVVRFKSNHLGKFWRRSPNWIWADTDDTSTKNSDTLFEVIKIEEAVLSRKISNIEYHLKGAKIFDKKAKTLITREAVNGTSTDSKTTITLKYSVIKGKLWDSSKSMKLGVTTTIEAGVPVVLPATIEVQSEFNSTYSWGESIIEKEEYSNAYEVVVPAYSVVTVSVLATQGICQVPFSYTQEDVLTTGERKVFKFDDGIFRGVNSFGFKSEVTERKLSKDDD